MQQSDPDKWSVDREIKSDREPRRGTFLVGRARVCDKEQSTTVAIRNLSRHGFLVQGLLNAVCHAPVEIAMEGKPPLKGTIAWVKEDCCGVQSEIEIDPAVYLSIPKAPETTPRFLRPINARHLRRP